VARDLAEGRLVALFREEQSELAYHLVHRPGREPRTLRPFVRWLRQVAMAGQKLPPVCADSISEISSLGFSAVSAGAY
jgi:hypothetical protein